MTHKIPVDQGAEAFIELLNANDVEYIFINPGTDTPAIQEAVAKFKALDRKTPEIVLCLHETVAMAAAHGHFMVSGKPQVVLVHTGVGTQQVGGALHNAQVGYIGMIFCAGKTPLPYDDAKLYGRFIEVHWYQDQYDQSGIVREYVKWYHELRSNEIIHTAVQRAFQVANTPPCGPVYLTLPPNLLMEKIKSVPILQKDKYQPPITPQGDITALDNIASILLKARNPLIILGDSGRHPTGVADMVKLAELVGARVITSPIRLNFPTNHPLCSGETNANAYLGKADAVLYIDRDVPYIATQAKPGTKATIMQIDIDPIKQNMPLWSFPIDIPVWADSAKAVPELNNIIEAAITPRQKTSIKERVDEIDQENNTLREKWGNLARAESGQTPISPDWLCYCLNQILDENTVLLTETVSNAPPLARQIHLAHPGATYTSGGTSLGWSLGAAIGAKLADPEKMPIVLVGDGAFMFGCPIEAIWAAEKYHAPFLTVVLNNRLYKSPLNAVRRTYGLESYSEKTGNWMAMNINPSPDFAAVAEACGAYGQTVTDPKEVLSALKKAAEVVRSGRSALVDVHVAGI
ncbi:thiamine pyrophosphate-requiring protein [Chloroflexota bacterium]